MRVKDINSVIEQFEALPLEEKEYTVALMQKAYAEAARNALAQRVKQANRNAKAGKTKKGGVAELRKDLQG
jgi:hypothetical protein